MAFLHEPQPPWTRQIHTMPEAGHLCGPCQMRFKSAATWAVHAFKCHQRINQLRQFTQGTSCMKCAKDYFSHTRLVRHLKYNKECAAYHLARYRPSDPEPGRNSRHFNRNEPEVLSPPVDTAVEIEGPLPLPYLISEEHPHGETTELLLKVFDTPIEARFDFSSSTTMWSVVEELKKALLTYPLPYSQIVLTYQDFRENGFDLAAADIPLEHAPIWKHAIDVVSWKLCPAWLVPLKQTTVENPHREAAYEWLQTGPILTDFAFPHTVPRIRPERFLVHFFAGRRRSGDLQQKLEEIASPPGVVIHVISLDLIYGADADLFDPDVRSKWLQAFRQRRVAGFFAGPPCESWSVARFVDLPDSKVRPIRSATLPWGLFSLSLRELRQIITANVLMLFSLLCLAIQIVHGLYGMIEHPGRPREDHKPSIWNTQLWKIFSQLPVTELTVLQGYFGGISPKPTILSFAQHLPWLEEHFRRFRTTTVLPKGETTGRDSTGAFRTAVLKEYPPGLNQAIAASYERWQATTTFEHEDTPLPQDLLDLFNHFEIELHTTLGADYVPSKARIINVAWIHCMARPRA